MNKVILIGIDGATPQLVNTWVKDGLLPTFKHIKHQGCSGHLASTIPPFSAPAWTSIVTGCNPGKHGIYGFESTGTLTPHLITSKYRKAPAIWNYLTHIGVNNIIVNVPGSYPPDNIKGVMITGLLTPSFDSEFTYPQSIKQRLNKEDLGDYELEHFWLEDFSRSRMKKRAPEKLLTLINDQMQSRATVALNLMQSMPWDFAMIVFRGTDTAQHFLFHRKDLLLQCYQKVDTLINQIINRYPDASIVIVSDHGFEPIKKVLYPDNVLYNSGYLTPIWDPLKNYSSLLLAILNQILQKFLGILPSSFLRKSPKLKQLLLSRATKENLIDFSKTKAFSTADGRGLQICFKTKYEKGIVLEKESHQIQEDLKKLFQSLKDPHTAQPLIKQVYSSDEVYGHDAHEPPDIILAPKQGITASEWIRYPQNIKELLQTQPRALPIVNYQDVAGRSGDHAEYGIFYATGKNVKTNHIVESISVEDILPLIFSLLNKTPPPSITGKIPYEIFDKKPTLSSINWVEFDQKKDILSQIEKDRIAQLRKKIN
jgi:predicted AlkP superfamily phosphohydrolase/phosphomutase